VPLAALTTETASFDTIGAAFFARVSHCDVRRWRRLLVLTSAYHAARTKVWKCW
jgi:uncharacterized SAM-binding protein YcdF (DUF218 family)